MEQDKNNDHGVWSALSLLAEHIYSRFLWSVHTRNDLHNEMSTGIRFLPVGGLSIEDFISSGSPLEEHL